MDSTFLELYYPMAIG